MVAAIEGVFGKRLTYRKTLANCHYGLVSYGDNR